MIWLATAAHADCGPMGRALLDVLQAMGDSAPVVLGAMNAEGAQRGLVTLGATEARFGRTPELAACTAAERDALSAFTRAMDANVARDLARYEAALHQEPPGDAALARAREALGAWRAAQGAAWDAGSALFPAYTGPESPPDFTLPAVIRDAAPADELPASAWFAVEGRWVAEARAAWTDATAGGAAAVAGETVDPARISAACARIEALGTLRGDASGRDRLAKSCRAWEALARGAAANPSAGKRKKLAAKAKALAASDASDAADVLDPVDARWEGAPAAIKEWLDASRVAAGTWTTHRLEEVVPPAPLEPPPDAPAPSP